jgi:hypothetical protein
MPTLSAALDSDFEIVNVKNFGALGNGSHDDTAEIQAAVDYAFGSAASPHGTYSGSYTTGSSANKILYFPPGIYNITAPILFTKLVGGRIMGAGRFVSYIKNVGVGSCFVTNGCSRSHFSDMSLEAGSGEDACSFDLNFDGEPGGNALQSNLFMNMDFGGGDYGCRIGAGLFMGSENTFQNCFFTSCAVAAISTLNFNALQQSVIGGNIQACGTGIQVGAGSVPIIQGVGFQNQTVADITLSASARDNYVITGCRSEGTATFLVCGSHHVFFAANTHAGPETETSYLVDGVELTGEIVSCISIGGKVRSGDEAMLSIRNCVFERDDWLDAEPSATYGNIEIENVRYGGSRYVGGGTLIRRQRITSVGTFNYDVTAV